jgi:AcrR family transcriptional regulator
MVSDSAATRARILDAAFQVVRDQGLTNATTKQIARAANLTEGALYKHFPDKFGLLHAALVRHIPGLDELDVIADTGVSTQQALHQIIIRALSYAADLGPIMLQLGADPELQRAFAATLAEEHAGSRDLRRWLTNWIVEQPQGHLLDAEQADTLTHMIYGACISYTLDESHPTTSGFAARLTSAAMTIISNPPAPTPTPRI